MKKLFILFVLCAVFSTGCARTAIIRRFPATDGVIVPIEKPVERLVVGEKFTFRVTWNGIPAGTATSEVEELTKQPLGERHH